MKVIPLYGRGQRIVAYADVDDEDYDRLIIWRWNLTKDGYAARSYRTAEDKAIRTMMHRQLLGLQYGERFLGDHINRDRLDNRKANLRICTPEESPQNRGVQRRSRSRFRGVNFVPRTGRWIARVYDGTKNCNLGTYDTEEDAARAAAEYRAAHMPYSAEGTAARAEA